MTSPLSYMMGNPLGNPYGSSYGSPYGMAGQNNLINSMMANSSLGQPSFAGDELTGAGSQVFQPPKMPQSAQVPQAQMPTAAAPSFSGYEQEPKSGKGLGSVALDALGVIGAAGAGFHGVNHFYNPKLEGENLLNAHNSLKVAQYTKVGAKIENTGKLLDEIIAANGDKTKLSSDAVKLDKHISDLNALREGKITGAQRLKGTLGLNTGIKTITPESLKANLAKSAETLANKVGALKTLKPDELQKTGKHVDLLTKIAKTKAGKIAAVVAGGLALICSAFRD